MKFWRADVSERVQDVLSFPLFPLPQVFIRNTGSTPLSSRGSSRPAVPLFVFTLREPLGHAHLGGVHVHGRHQRRNATSAQLFTSCTSSNKSLNVPTIMSVLAEQQQHLLSFKCPLLLLLSSLYLAISPSTRQFILYLPKVSSKASMDIQGLIKRVCPSQATVEQRSVALRAGSPIINAILPTHRSFAHSVSMGCLFS